MFGAGSTIQQLAADSNSHFACAPALPAPLLLRKQTGRRFRGNGAGFIPYFQ